MAESSTAGRTPARTAGSRTGKPVVGGGRLSARLAEATATSDAEVPHALERPVYTNDDWADLVLDATAPRPARSKPPAPNSPEWGSYWAGLGGEPSPSLPAPPAPAPVGGAPRRRPSVAAVVIASVLALVVGSAALVLLTRDRGVTKASFIAAADGVCRTTNDQVAGLSKPTSYPELATATGSVVSLTTTQLTSLRALPKPAGTAGTQADAVFEAIGGTTAAVQQLKDTAGGSIDDSRTIAATKQLASQFAETDGLAQAYGFTACGTGLQPGVTSLLGGSNTIVKAAFVAKADSLCRASANAFAAIPAPRNNTVPEWTRYLNAGVATMEKLSTDVKSLPVPPGDEVAIGELFAAQDKVNAKTREMRDSALRGDLPGVIASERELSPLVTAADAKWDDYGLDVCGSNFGS